MPHPRLDPTEAAAEMQRRAAVGSLSDPLAFARLLIEPDPWQQDVLRSEDHMLLNVARQCGKSSVCALLALYRAVSRPAQLILLISPSDRQSGELFRKVRAYLKALPHGLSPALVEDNKRSLELANGSRIVSLPSSEETIRGFSAVNLLIEDEAGDADDALYIACRPMLAVSRGQLVLAGTPKGKIGHYWDAWSNAEAQGFRRVLVRADQVPRVSPEFLAAERVVLGAAYQQEYECEFLAGVFGRVYGAFDSVRNLFVPPKDWKCTYHVLGMDYGFHDNCSWNVLGWNDHDPTVYLLQSYKRGGCLPPDAADEAKGLDRVYHFDKVVADMGGHGGSAYAEEARRRFSVPVEAAEKHNKRGYIDLFNGAMSRGLIKIVEAGCKQLLEEWPMLPWNEDRTKEAEGFPADCSDGTLYGWRAATNYHETPKVEGPKPGTTAHIEAMADRLEELATTEESVDWSYGA